MTKPTSSFLAWLFTAGVCALCSGCFDKEPESDYARRPWNRDLIYFVLIDRFHDGDTGNNVPKGSDPRLYDPEQQRANRYHGGDLRGLETAIEQGYFEDLGATALWLSPPVRNAWHFPPEDAAGYHGDWTQDIPDIDPHWTSAQSWDGKDYPEGRSGRLAHYRDFIDRAHAHGLKIICDIYTPRDLNTSPGSGHFDRLVGEFVKTYRFYIDELGVDGLALDAARRVDREFWDAFIKRLRSKFDDEENERLFLFGEARSDDPLEVGSFTYRVDGEPRPSMDSMLNFPLCFSLRSFLGVDQAGYRPLYELPKERRLDYALDEIWQTRNSEGRLALNPLPGPDGLNARQKLINFVGGHDGLNRFRAAGVSAENNALAIAAMMAMEGVPCLYYGSEAGLQAPAPPGQESESGRMTFIPRDDMEPMFQARTNRTFRIISSMAEYRSRLPALHRGGSTALWSDRKEIDLDNGLFAIARYVEKEGGIDPALTVLALVNAHSRQPSVTGSAVAGMRLVDRRGRLLVQKQARFIRLPIQGQDEGSFTVTPPVIWRDGVPEIKLMGPPKSLSLFAVLPERYQNNPGAFIKRLKEAAE